MHKKRGGGVEGLSLGGMLMLIIIIIIIQMCICLCASLTAQVPIIKPVHRKHKNSRLQIHKSKTLNTQDTNGKAGKRKYKGNTKVKNKDNLI
jgi:uncharacterized protein YpmB